MTGRDGTLSVWSGCPSKADSQFPGRVRPSRSVLDNRFANGKLTVISYDSRPTDAVCLSPRQPGGGPISHRREDMVLRRRCEWSAWEAIPAHLLGFTIFP